MTALVNVVGFVVMLSVIIAIHEFGHFIVAKFFNVYVYEYSLGMGPKLLQYKGKETKYTLRALPLGGYCAMAGEDDNANIQEVDGKPEVTVPPERCLNNLPWYKQIPIMLAGPVMNFILAFLIFVILYASIGYKVVSPVPYVNGVTAGSPAETAGFEYGDKIVKITYDDGTVLEPLTFYEIVEESYFRGGTAIYTVERNGSTLDLTVVPQFDEESQRYLIGIMAPESTVEYLTPSGVIGAAWEYFVDNSTMLLRVLGNLFKGIGLNNLSGPVGIYNATATEISYGFLSYLTLIGVLSLNIGVMNLIPVPLFDGGRIVIAVAEGIVRRPLSEKIKNGIMTASLVLVLMLFVLVTFNDITRLLK